MKKALFALLLLLGEFSFVWSQVIPDAYLYSWTHAGFTESIPVSIGTLNVQDAPYSAVGDGITNDQSAIQQAIDDQASGLGGKTGVVYLPPGTYRISSTLSLPTGIVLRGAGADQTTLVYDQATGHTIDVLGNLTSDIFFFGTDPNHGDSEMVLTDATGLSVGDFVWIYFNDAALVDWATQTVGQIVKITAKSGNILTIDVPLRRSYVGAASLAIRKLEPVRYVGVEELKIKRTVANPSALASDSYANIRLRYADHCWVESIESDLTDRAHVDIWGASHIEVTNSYFHDGHDYGGGKAYGVLLQYTSGDCLIENNIFQDLRHSVLLQAGANGNVVAYNYSREIQYILGYPAYADYVLHGNYPYANLFEGNIGQWMLADQQGEMNGPGNTFFRNRVEDVGIVNSDVDTDSMVLVGNEITGDGLSSIFVNYDPIDMAGLNHHLCKNHTAGSVSNGDCTAAMDISSLSTLYLPSTPPDFWPVDISFPPFGSISSLADGTTVPAMERYASGQTIAPVEWLSVDASQKEAGIEVIWMTAQEFNNDHFVVEKRIPGSGWRDIGKVPGSGTSQELNTYSFWDQGILSRILYYRIRQVDIDGSSSYSSVVSIEPQLTSSFRVMPNPIKEAMTLIYEPAGHNEGITFEVLDGKGSRIHKGRIDAGEELRIQTAHWLPGIYLVVGYYGGFRLLSSVKVRKF